MVGRAVFSPPYTAVRNLAEWAIDLWPYVNGKAIMSGVRLLDLTPSDMFDVIHYIFEADLAESMNEYAEVKDIYRIKIYEDFYSRDYPYASNKSRTQSFNPDLPPIGDEFGGPPGPQENFEQVPSPVTKRYVPPTEFSEDAENPYKGVLDAPLN